MKCFITGATGHLGNVLVKELYKTGCSITSLILPSDNIEVIEPYTDILYGNVLDYDFLKKAIINYDIVFHLAGMVEIGTGKKKKLYKINIEGTKNIIKVCQENKIKKLIYTSSVHAFKEAPRGEMMKEPKIFNPKLVKGHYAKSKAIASNLVLNQSDKNLETIIVCPSGVIGPFDYKLSNTGQLFIDYLMGRLTAYIKGSYNFVDVRDVVFGIIQAAKLGKDKEIFLLSGHDITVKELLDMISEITGRKQVKFRLQYWFIFITSYFAEIYYKMMKQKPLFTHYSLKVLKSNHSFDNSKAKEILNFNPRPIYKTVKDTLDFAKEYYLIKVGKKWKKKSMQ
ncbi:NAD-dependent epimerase/dehydratase family protein [Candidatus Izemoplasma sp. B36]|uniref:NAD-dependent epimerase/dehydratase family protein n=1 Tax=Candidatus Izemoplasma sp. B36 TaxID=3242468 RepID=UPI00355723A7